MEKYFMRHLLYPVLLLFLLLCCAGTSFAAVVRHLPQKGESALHAYTVAEDEKSGENWRPIRIKVSSDDVDKVLEECKRKLEIAKDRRPVWWSRWNEKNNVLCNNETGITDEKKDLLLNKLLPAAIKLHTDRLSIERERGGVGVSASTMTPLSSIDCPKKISELSKKESFPKADFVLFVGLAESQTPTRVCSEEENKRPTSALIHFVPKEIVDTRHFVRTAAHEIAHLLGFEVGRMQNYDRIKYGTVASNKKENAVYSEIMEKKMREHYGCVAQLVTGMYMEDEGDGRSKLHWERRIAKDELMSPYTEEPSGMFYTNLTLAAFHSLPFYSANFSMAEPMSWGNKSGCDLLHKTCTKDKNELMKYTSMFCDENGPVLQCTSDRFALGTCSSKSLPGTLPGEYHYFTKTAGQNEMTNGCPIVKPLKETTCESGNVELMPGSIVSKMSRCLNVKEPEFSEGDQRNGVTVKGICAKVKCENGKVSVQYKGMKDTHWIECSGENATIKLESSAFKGGSIVCPRYEEVCTGLPDLVDVTSTEEEEQEVARLPEVDNKGNEGTAGEPVSSSIVESETNMRSERTPVSEGSYGVSSQTPIVPQAHESNPVRGDVDGSTGKEDAAVEESKLSNNVSGSRDNSAKPQGSDQEKNVLPPSEVPGSSDITHSDNRYNFTDVSGDSTHVQQGVSSIHMGIVGVEGTDKSLRTPYTASLALLVCVLAVVLVP
ncbi:surface protease GP63 [Trypanosoma theileri]|uniref:Leishmanolysin-like peptidase n=1 Tax=Trypanosoma theileri TaxID=67003 RepID=A0A1X0NN43_9TRYP|nr:surface protease GP63 [Trypanosoma theileri]ORC85908.1 surface protease GP63 [Trypanosoma theileri]